MKNIVGSVQVGVSTLNRKKAGGLGHSAGQLWDAVQEACQGAGKGLGIDLGDFGELL